MIVWQAGPAVVFLGIVFRIVTALLPIGLLAISKLIIDNIVGVVAHHQPVPRVLWWIVGAEFALAASGSMLTRVVDYLDSVLADKYTRYVSIEVMRHAAGGGPTSAGSGEAALILSTAFCSVPATSGFAALLKPMWLSLI